MTPRPAAAPPPGPLSAIEFEVLLALHDEEMHGYGLAKAIEHRTGGRLRLEPANLYRRLNRLVDAGYVAPTGRRPVGAGDDERRRYFRLTAGGRRALTAEALRLRDQVRAAVARRIVADTGGSD